MDTVSTILIVTGVWLFIGLVAGIFIGKGLRRIGRHYPPPRHRASR